MTKTICAGVFTIAAMMSASFGAVASAHEGPHTYIHAGWLLDVPGTPPKSQQTIIIGAGKIETIQNGFTRDAGSEIIDLSDSFVLPGLIDSHVHLRGEWSPTSRLDTLVMEDEDVAFEAAKNAKTTLMAGFTAVQDVGGPKAIFALRRAVNDGKVPGPHIRAAGRSVSATGGHGDMHGYRGDILHLFDSPTLCNGADDCRRAVRTAVKSGADVIKITATGGVLSNTNAGTEQQFFDDELTAIVETAKKMGRKVTAHAHGKTGIESALKAGVASIEHGTYLDAGTARLFRQYNATLVPTVIAGKTVEDWALNYDFLPPASAQKALQVGPQMQDMLRIALKGGVRVAFGTDSGVSPHGLNAKEFQYMVEAGMSEMDAIKAATVIASEHIEMADQIGTLEAGKEADIIAVHGNPLDDISELMDVDFVMKGGTVYKHQ